MNRLYIIRIMVLAALFLSAFFVSVKPVQASTILDGTANIGGIQSSPSAPFLFFCPYNSNNGLECTANAYRGIMFKGSQPNYFPQDSAYTNSTGKLSKITVRIGLVGDDTTGTIKMQATTVEIADPNHSINPESGSVDISALASSADGTAYTDVTFIFSPDNTVDFSSYSILDIRLVISGHEAGYNDLVYDFARNEDNTAMYWLGYNSYANHRTVPYLKIEDDVVEKGDGSLPGGSDDSKSDNSPPPPAEPSGPRPVIIVPGIMGTELYDGDDLIWPNVSRLLTSLSDDFLSDGLNLDDQGNSIRNLNLGDIIKDIVIRTGPIIVSNTDTFQSLINTLEDNGYTLDQNFFLFPYDWRLDLNTNKVLLNNKIDEIKTQTGFLKVNVVAHSMGGLVTEDYINQYGTDDIDKLVFVGTPHLGAPKAANALLAGDIGTPLNIVNANRIKEISRNSPSIYELLPNQKYFDVFQGYLKPMPSNGNILTYSESKEFLSGIGKNSFLINQTQAFFDQQLQDLDYGNIQVFNITGCKTGTQAFYNVDASNGNVLNTKFSTGDGTVPFISADYSSGVKYYARRGKHSSLPSMKEVKELILDILTTANENYATSNVSRLADFCQLTGKALNWRSPVTVQIYDALGNHSGPLDDGTIENNIPGASYDMIDGEAYIFLPTDEGQTYTIEGTGTDNSSFDLIVTDINNDQVTSNTLFDNVRITPGSGISFVVSQDSDDSQITVDSSNVSAISQSADQIEILTQAMSTPAYMPSSGGVSGGASGISYSPPEPSSSQPKQNDGKILGEKTDKLADGTLVLDTNDNRTVYIIGDSGKKYGFTNETAFKGLGFNFNLAVLADVSGYELGGLISYPDEIHPNGSLVFDGQTIWWINNEKRYGFASIDELEAKGFSLNQVVKANINDLLLNETKELN